MTDRKFEDTPGVRATIPLLAGVYGMSGSGKTFSGLRLATGIQEVVGGDIFGIDTEANRMLHYADRFKFRHVPFKAPFSPLDYLDAIDHCVRKGAKTIIVDSMSHEHEGAGGVLDWHDTEQERLAKGDAAKFERVNMLAWKKPKAARKRMLDYIVHSGVNFVLCFRAKEKLKLIKGKPEPLELGFMPIAGEEIPYEMTINFLLMPASNGIPTWRSEQPGEKQMIKLPEQFKEMFKEPQQITEATGKKLAEWCSGRVEGPHPMIEQYQQCATPEEYAALEATREKLWKDIRGKDKAILKSMSKVVYERLMKEVAGPVPNEAGEI